MNRQIRRNTFETNSSSVHSLVICSAKEFGLWKNGELLLNPYTYKGEERFIKASALTEEEKEEARRYYEDEKRDYWKEWEALTEKECDNWYLKYSEDFGLSRSGYFTYERYMNDNYLEAYEESYTSESGDEIVIFGKYGYDG